MYNYESFDKVFDVKQIRRTSPFRKQKRRATRKPCNEIMSSVHAVIQTITNFTVIQCFSFYANKFQKDVLSNKNQCNEFPEKVMVIQM